MCLVFTDQVTDIIHMRPDCSGYYCRMFLGADAEQFPNEFHLTDSELDRVTSLGQLVLGDWNTSTDIDYIQMKGISLEHAPVKTLIYAGYPTVILFFCN